MTLQDKRVVVLGGTAGIGLAVAQAAAAAGAQLVIASSSQARVARALGSLPAHTVGRALDLADERALRDFFDGVGAFDHLVFTAGERLRLTPLAATELGEARRRFDLRYWGALAAAQHAVPRLRAGGSIVFTGGSAAKRAPSGWSVAASICGAMEALTRALAVELAPIRVNLVAPGLVRTELWAELPDDDREALFRAYGQKLPVGRVGEPADVAQTYLSLMSNGYTSGQIVTVDGGGVLV
jgi:NAD(P)-dependent dehydrogenase (short-subunit alcohol dehydrogenase family)